MTFSKAAPEFEGYSSPEMGKHHQGAICDAVEDLLQRVIESWNSDQLSFAEAASEDLRQPILDLIAQQHKRLIFEMTRAEERQALLQSCE